MVSCMMNTSTFWNKEASRPRSRAFRGIPLCCHKNNQVKNVRDNRVFGLHRKIPDIILSRMTNAKSLKFSAPSPNNSGQGLRHIGNS